jgi:hypothetical protein
MNCYEVTEYVKWNQKTVIGYFIVYYVILAGVPELNTEFFNHYNPIFDQNSNRPSIEYNPDVQPLC